MLNLLRQFLWGVSAVLLALRYRIRVTGLEKVRGLTHAVILPNHPGYIDPPLVIRTLWPALRPRPLLLGSMFNNPLLYWLPRVFDAVIIPDVNEASAQTRQDIEQSLAVIVEGLKSGHNHILWPSGRVYRSTGRESLGAARSLAEILQAAPETKLVLVRTRGVWGSMFSYARTGDQPNLAKCLLKGAGILLCNLLLFAPRRNIEITIEVIDRASLPGTTREAINPFLEAWYNAPGEEKPTYVPYHFLSGRRTFAFPEPAETGAIDISKVRPATRAAVAEMVIDKLKGESSGRESDPDTKLDDLGFDSLDRMEIALEVERRFGFNSGELPSTISGLWAVAEGLVETAEPKPAPAAWLKPPATRARLTILDETISGAFVKRCLQARGNAAAVDDISKMVTYERLLIGTILLSRRFARLEGNAIGILLPASVAATSAYFAALLAGKLPVLMNWTTGPANLAHARRVMNLKHVITSRKFVDRINVTVEGAQYEFMEDIRDKISKLEMLRTLMRVKFTPGSILRGMPKAKADDLAVVLFTSGSEKAPKAVPLTHRNILSNLTATLDAFDLTTQDSLMGFLPPFHSFGLTVTTILPALTGARVAYHPDPTDSATIVRKVKTYRTTILLGTPAFMSLIMTRCHDGDLASVRLAVVGAEKCPESVFQLAALVAPKATLIEGYGITECAPIVAANRAENRKRGSVGLPIANVKLKIVDIDTYTPLAQGETGMLLIHGPNVFPGYIGNESDPFTQQDHLRWYVSGDLARIDEDGFVWLAGRLKRFLKAGGEMISLPALEEPLSIAYPPDEDGPRVAVEGVEDDSGRRIVLFTTQDITLRSANELLQSAGLRGIMRLSEVRRLEKLPVLGSGKTDYKVLRAMIQ